MKENNLTWHTHKVSRENREQLKRHTGAVVWFSGLSGSGKSTLAGELEEKLYQQKCHTYLLDGDNVRHGLCQGLGFSKEDRQENLRRVAEVAKLMADAGLIVLASFISPLETDRELVKSIIDKKDFYLVHVDTPLEFCEERDPKGLYQKARRGEIKDFTGISAPFEDPTHPCLKTFGRDEPIQDLLGVLQKDGVIKE